MLPTLNQLAVLRAAQLCEAGAIFRIDGKERASCIRHGWLTQDGELTARGQRILLEEMSGQD